MNHKPRNKTVEPMKTEIDVENNDLRKHAAEMKAKMKAECTQKAYSLLYNKETKKYEIVTLVFSLQRNDAYIDSVEVSSDHQLIAFDAVTTKFDLAQIKKQGKEE